MNSSVLLIAMEHAYDYLISHAVIHPSEIIKSNPSSQNQTHARAFSGPDPLRRKCGTAGSGVSCWVFVLNLSLLKRLAGPSILPALASLPSGPCFCQLKLLKLSACSQRWLAVESGNFERQPLAKGGGGKWMLKDKPGNVPCKKRHICICTDRVCFNFRETFFSKNAKNCAGRKLIFLS